MGGISESKKGKTMEKQKKDIIKLDFESLGLLELCTNIEIKIAELYRFFAELFIENTKISALWNKTANEEDNHAEQFRLAVRLKGMGMANVKTDHSKIKFIAKNLDAILLKFKESNPKPAEALMFAIQIERKLADCHMSILVDFDDSDLEKLFKAMANNDIGHVDMLQKALKEISIT